MLGEFDVVTGGPDGNGGEGFWATDKPVKLHATIREKQSSLGALLTSSLFNRLLNLPSGNHVGSNIKFRPLAGTSDG